MTMREYNEEINPCYGCDCWDEDMGCTMPPMEKSYACPLENTDPSEPKPKTIEFFMSMKKVPTMTHQEKKIHVVNGKPVLYEPQELKEAREYIRSRLVWHAPQEPYTKAVRLTTWWCFPIKGKHKDGEYKTSRPDTDNLVKMLKDVMTELHFWKDDALVASEVIEKYWSEITGIYVKVESL